MNLTIKAKVFLLALVPPILIAVFLTWFNVSQSNDIGRSAVDDFKQQMEQDAENALSNYLQLAMSAIQHLVNDPSLGTLQERQQRAKQILRQLRFDDSGDVGYLFVYDTNGVNIAHGVNQSLEGRNLYDFQDPNGTYLIRELINAAQAGGGYVNYGWQNNQDSVAPKLGYAQLLEEWGWVVGTGFWIEGLERQAGILEDSVEDAISSALIQTIIASLIALAIIAALALFVVRSITRPLANALAAMDDIAKGDGDLSRRLSTDSHDEMAELGQAFNYFADQVADMVSQIRHSAVSVNQSTKRLDSVLQRARDGVNEQQQESEQVATAVNELAAASHQVAQSAGEASHAAEQAEQLVHSANKLLGRAVNVINGLATQVEQGNQSVERLADQSAKIGSVLDVIRGIADQTNLLALNAAIESARAGEAGRGFAVVADEVRTLAKRTQDSTHEIETMIEKLQQGSADVSAVMDAINTQNAQIATAAEEQTSVSETINQNMTKIVDIATDTAAGTEQAGEHMRELVDTAKQMESTVHRYRID